MSWGATLGAVESDLQHIAIPLTQTPFLPALEAGMEQGQRL